MSDTTTYDDALALKGALEDLLGSEEWSKLRDTRSVTTWRKSLLRALKMSEAAIAGTVAIADEHWRTESISILRDGKARIQSAASIVDILAAFGACYMRLSFHQVGHMPKRKGRRLRVRAVPAEWNLSSYRSVQYVQSDTQKLSWEFSQDQRPLEVKALDPKYCSLSRR